jgi:hypothetical protein
MSWKKLLAEGRVDQRPTSPQEIKELREMVKRNLKDAAVEELSAEGRFSHAYDAGRVLAEIPVRCCGYRIKVQGGFHYNTFLALEAAMDESFSDIADYLDRCRQKRNEYSYDIATAVSEHETHELFQKVKELQAQIEQWLKAHHPNFLK